MLNEIMEEKYCKLCNSKRIIEEYAGIIRNGGLGQYTDNPVTMYRCEDCRVIWHERMHDSEAYYQSDEYRNSLEGTAEEEEFYRLHDKETLAKLSYTGTEIYRNKIVADIGCGCGAFIDYIKGVAKEIIAVEPTSSYREILKRKGFLTFAYGREAADEFSGRMDVVTSFDVIEHVDDPIDFLKDIYSLLTPGGRAFIGTPTETPIMRELLGSEYEKKLLFSTQHIWVFAKENLKLMAEKAGFSADRISFKYSQRYGIGNMLGWVRDKEPKKDIDAGFLTRTLDSVWKSECESKELSDYIILCLRK